MNMNDGNGRLRFRCEAKKLPTIDGILNFILSAHISFFFINEKFFFYFWTFGLANGERNDDNEK